MRFVNRQEKTMRIKNKARLVARAEAHRKADRFIQGIYIGEEEKFQGCEIGCLAMPVRVTAAAWSKRTEMDDDELCELIGAQFGVCEGLLREAEYIFETMPSQRRAANFAVAFVKALPEGADVSDDDVFEWSRRCTTRDEKKYAFLPWLRRGCPAPHVKAA